ncbi:hypothetical protein D3C85_1583480 [compost metagenome]
MQVVAKVRGLFVEALLRHECLGLQVNTVLVVEPDDTQAQPLIQHHPPADVGADLRHQGIEGTIAANARQARQRQRLARRRAERLASGPHIDQLCT